MSEKKQKQFHGNCIMQFFRNFEAKNYSLEKRVEVEKKFTDYYMSLPDWQIQYQVLLDEQYKIKEKGSDASLGTDISYKVGW